MPQCHKGTQCVERNAQDPDTTKLELGQNDIILTLQRMGKRYNRSVAVKNYQLFLSYISAQSNTS